MSSSALEGGKYFHRDGSPAETYNEVMEEIDNGIVAEEVVNGVPVRTYFTGYNIGTFVEPKIFSTSIPYGMFAGEYEYASEAEAVAGHKMWVEKITVPIPEDVEALAAEIRALATNNEYQIANYILHVRNKNIADN